jgi:hypothetical protein
MTYGNRIKSSLFILLLMFSNGNLLAQECDQSKYSAENYDLMLIEFAVATCLDFKSNNTPLGNIVKRQLNDSSLSAATRASRALNSIQNFLTATYSDPTTDQFNNARIIETSVNKLNTIITDNPDAPVGPLRTEWQLDSLDPMPDALKTVKLLDPLDASNCGLVGDKTCAIEFEQAADMVRIIHLVNAAIDTYSGEYRADALVDRKMRRASWDSYYDDLTFQYPWELWANSWLLETFDNREGEDGNKLGFRNLPGSKLILLHPEATLVYAENANDEYDISLSVEALGYEAFKFGGAGKVKDWWGISLLAAYMPEPNTVKSGWTAGLLFKYSGYSLGVTDNHGDTGIIFNINLAQKIFDVKQEARQYYDELSSNF